MSWQIFKQNILRLANNPESIKDIDTVAKAYALEYDAAMKRGRDVMHGVSVKRGNVELMEQLFKAAFIKGQSSTGPYDLVGEMGKGVLAYWQGAELNNFPIPLIPSPGATVNVSVTSNVVTNPGTWAPVVSVPSIPEPSVEELLAKIPDDNNTLEAATPLVEETGVEVLTDGGDLPSPQISDIQSSLPPDNPPFQVLSESDATQSATEDPSSNSPITNKEGSPINCGSGIDYNQKLSPNYRLRDLSIGTIFPHKIKAQAGFTEQEIVCNLQYVAENILEPFRAQFPKIRVNSAFRGKPSIPGGTSQHEKGEAVDIQIPGISPKDYLTVANWIKANLPFDQLIFEHGNSIWLHMSCSRTRGKQRKQLLTMLKGKYEPGLKCYYA